MGLVEDLKRRLSEPRNDERLHFSQHLQHDRHTAIYMEYGYPNVDQPWGRIFPLVQGTGVHESIHATMAKMYPKYVPEREIIAADKTLEFEWAGTADAYVEINNVVYLLDYKTISGAGMSFLEDTPKPEHIFQVSAYYHFGPTQNCQPAVLYLPSSPDYTKKWAEPRFITFEPISKTSLLERMKEVEDAIWEYKEHLVLPDPPEGTWSWKKRGKTYRLEYRPHYTTMFCPWASLTDDPCGCSLEKSMTVATYKDGDLTVDDEYAIMVEKIGLPDESEEIFPEV